MNMPFSNYSPNSEKFQKHPRSSNLISFWAFLVSIFIYISVFYAFHLSPSTLLSTPKFWFIISNTLIIIIAVDFSASENHHPDSYVEENINGATSFEIRYEKLKKPTHVHREKEKIIRVVEDKLTEEKVIEIVVEDKLTEEKVIEIVPDLQVMKREAKNRVVRSNSEKSNNMSREKVIMRKTLSEKYDNVKVVEGEEEEPRFEENEFSSMSDEEVNRRVEEFIERFKRQIRLQSNTS